MKFGEKYELLESLTTGAVETFIANDKVRGERVLVHILHGDPQKPNQPTVQWVLDSFRRVAPEPVGLVLVVAGAIMSVVGLVASRRLVRPIGTTERVFVEGGPQWAR